MGVVFSITLAIAGFSTSEATASTASTTAKVPTTMAALGDSITRGFNACGWYVDCTSRSWSPSASGDAVTSHFERLRAISPRMAYKYNDARSGARVAALPAQAAAAVTQGAGYITILMGANDACRSSESLMTPVEEFRSHFASAMAALDPDRRGIHVFVASIPDVHRLWEVGSRSWSAISAWDMFDVCQSMLANPLSTSDAAVARRLRVRQRVMDYNAVMAEVCAQYARCQDDGGAVFSYRFELSHLSRWDYFHPNERGQAVLADVTWAAGFAWRA